MTTRTTPRSGGVQFGKRNEEDSQKTKYGSDRDKGRQSTQESDSGSPRYQSKYGRGGSQSHAQGEFSGLYDKKGHHLKSDGTPDMRFKENREEFEGQGYEYSSQGGAQRGRTSGMTSGAEEKEEESTEKRVSPRTKSQFGQRGKSSQQKSGKSEMDRGKSTRQKSTTKQRGVTKSKGKTEHEKGDGTPDMRFKENREKYSGEGFEGTTSRSTRISKANIGIVEGNTPGEHSGKYDREGHHLKNDGTPDMRFVENRNEFSGQGYEQQRDEKGNSRRTPKYLLEEDNTFTDKVYYKRKRPPTPYALYVRENASQMKKENPDMDMNEVFRELGKDWRNSSDKYKKTYYDMYEQEVKRFEDTGHLPHRGGLSFRKIAEKRGLKIDTNYGMEKRSKFDGGNRMKQRYREEENEDEDEDYTPTREEENLNPNQAATD
jgi:hypothetical protein